MSLPRVYIDTTIPSYFHERRTDPRIVTMKQQTRAWWESAHERYEVVTGIPVIREIVLGPGHERPLLWLDFLRGIDFYPVDETASGIAEEYIRHKLMPADPNGDALHLALASLHRCDVLLTWDIKHLANPNKIGHIQRVNSRLGLFVLEILTPSQLLERDR